jgi:hypothetical protein
MLNEFVPTFTTCVGTHIFGASKYITCSIFTVSSRTIFRSICDENALIKNETSPNTYTLPKINKSPYDMLTKLIKPMWKRANHGLKSNWENAIPEYTP